MIFLSSSFTKIAMTVKRNNIVKPLSKWWRVIFFPNFNFHAPTIRSIKAFISNNNNNILFAFPITNAIAHRKEKEKSCEID